MRQQHPIRCGFVGLVLCGVLFALGSHSLAKPAPTQPATAIKSYRGSIGNSHIEMSLQTDGEKLTGTYSYDRIRQTIKLNGRVNKQGGIELSEYDAAGTQTGLFVCKRPLDDPIDSECTWSKPNGTGGRFVSLHEQHIAFTNGLRLVPKVVTNRTTGVDVSYPQIIGANGPMAVAAENFNRRMGALVASAIKEFVPGDTPGRNSFDTNYTVLLGTNKLISVEMYEMSDGGGAHPNDRYWAMNYDLPANRELKLGDLFNANADYSSAIADYVVADINKRVEQFDREDARREGKKPQPREEPLMSVDQLSELDAFAITPKGLMVYFDFPHVIAVFDKTFIPYSFVADQLQLVPPSDIP